MKKGIIAAGLLVVLFGGMFAAPKIIEHNRNELHESASEALDATNRAKIVSGLAPASEVSSISSAPSPTIATKNTSTSAGLSAGMYKVGTDITAGEYVLLPNVGATAYFEITSDSTGTLDSVIANDNFTGRSYITVSDGEYLNIKRARLYTLDTAPMVDTSTGILSAGMYKVGVDIPAGEYKISSTRGNVSGSLAYFETSIDSSHQLSSIVTNDNFDGERYVTVTDGQYIKLSGCTLSL